jgi:hypothetical protein
MLQLIISLDDKNNFTSKENSAGKWFIYLEKSGQRDKVVEKYFSSYDMVSELEKAVTALNSLNKKLD